MKLERTYLIPGIILFLTVTLILGITNFGNTNEDRPDTGIAATNTNNQEGNNETNNISENKPVDKLLQVETFTIDKIFDGIEQKPDNDVWTLTVTGDVMLGRMINYNSVKENDFAWAFKNVGDILKRSDLTLINLESPLNETCPTTMTGMIFCAKNDFALILKEQGVDLAGLANNHALNQKKEGLYYTEKVLNESGIFTPGVKNPVYKEINGLKIAFLAFNDVECYPDYIECSETENIIADLKDVEDNADYVIVLHHWGNEYQYQPTNRQKELAYISIDNGADLVLGNHPHWYQSVESYKDKLIVYSHGNFIFDQMWSTETKEGLAGEYIFYKNQLLDVVFTPVTIKNYGQVEIADENTRVKIMNNLKEISYK
jgi:poly-gamma-glutamate capsule biosynthesis protein CapA/YwtB (metallophosphatase superfamily)